ncbi:MAG: hypothetical protein JWM55_664 [Acidimicrobiaceae bacterium]|nr:hypothetical protein [Acidimicrobiaceae bacterium]
MSLFQIRERGLIRLAVVLVPFVGPFGVFSLSDSTVASASTAVPTCSASQLTMSTDDGRGAYSAAGNQGVAFIFRNISTMDCSLKGYPKFRFSPSSYRGKSTEITQNGWGEIFAKLSPRLVVIKPSATASFGINYGDAYNQSPGYNVASCMTNSATARLPVQPDPYSRHSLRR